MPVGDGLAQLAQPSARQRADGREHEVSVDLTVYIPYIVIGDDEVLHIEEHDTKTMKAVTA